MLDGLCLSHVLKPMSHAGATMRQLDTPDMVGLHMKLCVAKRDDTIDKRGILYVCTICQTAYSTTCDNGKLSHYI